MSYTEVAITGYNTNPPPDDGSMGSANQVFWSKVKIKLFDPIRDAFNSIDDNVLSAVNSADSSIATLESDIATLDTAISNIATTMKAPDGTAMLYRQTTPPTGWTKGTDLNDYALRLVTGTASTGGSTAFSSVFASRTISSTNMPAHTHSFSDSNRSGSFTATTFIYNLSDSNASASAGGVTCATSITESNETLTATYTLPETTTASAGSGTGWDFDIQYVDTIYATKD